MLLCLSLRVSQVLRGSSCPRSELARMEVQVLTRSRCPCRCGCRMLAPILLTVTGFCMASPRLDAQMILLVVIGITRSTVALLVLEEMILKSLSKSIN